MVALSKIGEGGGGFSSLTVWWTVAHHFYTRSTASDVLLRGKMTTRTSTALRDDLGWDKSPEIPSLSNGADAASPPLVVVGGIAFY